MKSKVKSPLVLIVGCVFIFYVLFPIILVFMGSFGTKWYGTILPTFFTLKWYKQLFTTSQYTATMVTSVYVAFLCVIISLAITILAVYALNTMKSKWLKKIFDYIVLVPVAIPPIVIAVGLIELYTFDNFSFVGTTFILVAAHLVITLPFMMKPIISSFDIINWKDLNEAADSLGSSFFYKIRKVLIPNILPGVISGSIMVFAMSLGEFQLALLLTGFKNQTYPIMLREAFYMSTGFACAATSVIIFIAFLSIIIMLLIVKKMGGETVSLQ